MSERRVCKYCGMELSEDVPHGLRECHLYAVKRIAGMEWEIDQLTALCHYERQDDKSSNDRFCVNCKHRDYSMLTSSQNSPQPVCKRDGRKIAFFSTCDHFVAFSNLETTTGGKA